MKGYEVKHMKVFKFQTIVQVAFRWRRHVDLSMHD